MKEFRIYISGKIGNGKMPTSEDLENATHKFYQIETTLREMGFSPINPLNLGFTAKMSYRDVMEYCKKVIRDQAHAIFMLNDWKESIGAKEEMTEAGKKGIPLYFESDMDRLQLEATHYYRIKEVAK